MTHLENHYSGHEAWYDTVELFYDFWTGNSQDLALLESLQGKFDLAVLIAGKFGNSNPAIVEDKIPALGNLSIEECLLHPPLVLRVREMLMRMPM